MAWWLLDSVINGTLDEDYPIMSKNEDDVVILGGESSDTITFTSDGIGAADTISLDQSWWEDDGFSVTGNPAGSSQDTLNLGPTRLAGGMGEDHISFSGIAGTQYDDPKYYYSTDAYKPQPDLKGPSHHKYQEDKVL